ncbi:hypothetical protein [Adlercreutzia sp. ZJ242]|uniref:CdiA C-terminal domain-containing protein n=1 Tax=Adlercreutzia sp. ZJ242 TaxID=2709409 RepID=UPI0013EE1789|nr:hypothetical protein [Adlercreutzia sp. ZJ242]
MEKRIGTIKAPSDLNVLPHEMDTARALADAGMDVEFVRRTWGTRVTSADLEADGVVWEVKSPTSGSLRVVEKHLRAALRQSRDVVFDARRMRGLSDAAVEREVAQVGRQPDARPAHPLREQAGRGCQDQVGVV